jgi:NAD(P)-dependent dehydrogenase (short-subunit alcohol dehydrogenase family)
VGATLVRRLAREGVNIAIVYRRSHDEAEALAADVRAAAGMVLPHFEPPTSNFEPSTVKP